MIKRLYQKARVARDQNFDGKFFFGVKTTGVFCRPSCPSPLANEDNVRYFETVFAALEQGYRPCLRCRPDINTEYYSKNIDGAAIVNSALKLIYDGYLSHNSVHNLAREFYISDRHLRKLFVENLGLPPIKIAKCHKALFAKKLLFFSDMNITSVAYAAGFGSVRQFNQVFKEIFGLTPSQARGTENRMSYQGKPTMLLKYNNPFNFEEILAYYRDRALEGVEVVTNSSYSRTFRTAGARGFFTVQNNVSKSALELSIYCDDIKSFMQVFNRVRLMFNLDTDFSPINQQLASDHILAPGMKNGQVPRLPVCYNSFELAIRAILGQQISFKAATTLAARLVKQVDVKTNDEFPEGLNYYFPKPAELEAVDLSTLGITQTRQKTIRNILHALQNNVFSLKANQSLSKFVKDIVQVKGIGDWTANYIAMRGLGMVDGFPASDLGVIKALSEDNKALSTKDIIKRAERWRPYRAYATLCLWNYAIKKEQN